MSFVEDQHTVLALLTTQKGEKANFYRRITASNFRPLKNTICRNSSTLLPRVNADAIQL